MALVFQDGFETWGTDATARTNMVNASKGWTVANSAAITTGGARTGTYACKLTSANGAIGPTLSLGGNKLAADGYFGVGFAVQISALPSVNRPMVQFINTNANAEWGLWVGNNGSVHLYQGITAILASSAAGVITPNVYIQFEIKGLMPTTSAPQMGNFIYVLMDYLF